MAQATLENVLDEIKTLTREELCRVDSAIWEQLVTVDDEAAKRARLNQALLASGLVKKIIDPSQRRNIEYPLIEIEGKPLSETIIEDRGR